MYSAAKMQANLGKEEVLQLLLLVRQCDYPSISVHHPDLLHSNGQLQLNGPSRKRIRNKLLFKLSWREPTTQSLFLVLIHYNALFGLIPLNVFFFFFIRC